MAIDLEPLSFAQPEVQRDPFPFVRKLLAGPRIYTDPLTGIPMVRRYADIAHVYAHPRVFSSRNPLIFARTTSPVADELIDTQHYIWNSSTSPRRYSPRVTRRRPGSSVMPR